MPSKRLYIPVAALDEPASVSFFECCLEPASQRDLGELDALTRLGLVQAAKMAGQAWAVLDAPGVRLTPLSLDLSITNSAGAALGLALSPYLADPRQPCHTSFVMGGLEFAGGDAKLSAVASLAVKLKAIRALGRPGSPALLLFADDKQAETRAEVEALVRSGFRVLLVQSLREARQACVETLS